MNELAHTDLVFNDLRDHVSRKVPADFAEPKTLRWQLWHAPGRVVRRARQHIVRILDDWPTADALLRAYTRLALLT